MRAALPVRTGTLGAIARRDLVPKVERRGYLRKAAREIQGSGPATRSDASRATPEERRDNALHSPKDHDGLRPHV
jgi:hypothetical protein